MDRENAIQEIADALAVLEDCSVEEIQYVRRFLRWLSDDALKYVRIKHVEAMAATLHVSG